MKEELMEVLGKESGKVFHAVYEEWCLTLFRYDDLRALFGTQEKCDLLNAVAPGFFGDVQRLFWNDLMLGVARLTDRTKGTVKLRSLERIVRNDPDLLHLLRSVKKHREDACDAAAPVLDRRHRVIAHRSLADATGNSEPLAPVKLGACKQVLDHAHAALNAIYEAKMNSSLANHIIDTDRQGETLLYRLDGLVDSVRFMASVIDPESPDNIDYSKVRAFLAKSGRPSDSDDHARLLTLARLARILRGVKRLER